MYRYMFSMIMLVALAGCTSLAEFQQMDTLTRTEFVCHQASHVANLASEQRRIRQKIAKTQTLLDKGYRVVETCDTQTIRQPKEICTQNKKNGVLVSSQCRVVKEPTVSKTCRETPINIDSSLEKARINRLQQDLANKAGQREAAFQSCFNRVGAMTAEEAYQYYQQN